MSKFLAFDLGAESGRAVLGELQGDRMKLTETARFPNKPLQVEGHLHWDVKSLFEAMLDGLKKTVQQHPDLLSLGCDTWGVDYVTLDENDRLLGNAYCYRDSRADGMMEKAFGLVPKKTIYAETGIQFMPINTLYQFLAASSGFGPPWKQARQCLMIAEYFHFLFSGKKVAEISLASTTQAWNPMTKQWSKLLLEKMGVPLNVMPPLVPPGTKLGTLCPDIAKKCGASASIQVVVPCSHDTGSAVAAVPAEGVAPFGMKGGGPKWAYLSSGTWSLLGAELSGPRITELGENLGFTNEAGLDETIRFLKNIVGLWIVQECRRYWEEKGTAYDYPTLTRLAREAKPFGPLINPDDERFLKPGRMPEKIADFCRETKQKVPLLPGEFARCALESLALKYRKTIEELERVLESGIDRLHIVGGGCQNELLCQFAANAIGRPVIAGPVEATALGNCLIQAKALGQVKNFAHLRQIVRNSFSPREYAPQQSDQWRDHYIRFQAICI